MRSSIRRAAAGRDRDEVLAELRDELAQVPGIVFSVEQPLAHLISHMLSGVKAQVGITLDGADLGVLRRVREPGAGDPQDRAPRARVARRDVPRALHALPLDEPGAPGARGTADGGDPDGLASAFAATDAQLCQALHAAGSSGRLTVEIAGRQYVGRVEGHTHAH
jgi:hypothetical protein